MNKWIWLVNPKGKEVEVSADRLETLLAEGYREVDGVINSPEIKDTSNSVIFFSEDTQHITGGRYYSWWLATAIKAAGYDVIIYTNRQPVFLNNFKDYPQPTVVIATDISKIDVKGKFYVGSPIVGNLQAIKLGEKYNKPSFCEIFDPFPMMSKYRGQTHWAGWDELIEELKKPHVRIISLCQYANSFIYDWLNKTKDQVFEVYPCINDKARDKTENKLEKENWITFISRLDFHKKLGHVLDAVLTTDCELHIISSVDGIGINEMIQKRGMKDQVKFHWNISDEEKFEIIKKSKVTINGSIFEGFGMWLAESLSCGVPCVCYDYPTFREIESYADRLVYYADWNDADDLARKLRLAIKENKTGNQCNKFNFDKMTERWTEITDTVNEPKIGVVMIALNEDKFIGASLRSVLDHKDIHKIAVVEGAVKLFAHASSENGLSLDNTKKEVLKVIEEDESGKIVYDRYGWAVNKSELRNRALDLVGRDCNYIMVLDADEVWDQKELNKLISLIKKNEDASIIWYPAYHFWKSKDQITVGSQWDIHLFRFFKYEDKTLHWNKHETPVVNNRGELLNKIGKCITADNIHFHHYGALKDKKRIQEKLEFYKKRDGDFLKVKDTWSDWKKGDETSWTHQGGEVIEFKGTHPKQVKGII